MDIPFEHVLRYTNEKDIPIYDIAASLIATDELKDLIPPLLQRLFPGLIVDKIELNLVQSAAGGSRKDDYTGWLFCRFQEDLENSLVRLAKKTGIEALQSNKRLISYLIMALVLAGALYAYERVSGTSSGTHIQGDYNTVVNLAAGEAGVSAETLKTAIETALDEREKRRLGQNAIDIASPAKREPNATITAAPDQSIELSPETIQQIPSRSDVAEEEDVSEVIVGLSIDVRRIDLDKRNVGWVGHVQIREFVGRVKMILVPGISPERLGDLSHRGPVIADVEVFSRRATNGQLRPYVIHVYRVDGLDDTTGATNGSQ